MAGTKSFTQASKASAAVTLVVSIFLIVIGSMILIDRINMDSLEDIFGTDPDPDPNTPTLDDILLHNRNDPLMVTGIISLILAFLLLFWAPYGAVHGDSLLHVYMMVICGLFTALLGLFGLIQSHEIIDTELMQNMSFYMSISGIVVGVIVLGSISYVLHVQGKKAPVHYE